MNRKRIIFGSLCVILLVALIGGTFAWFYINEEVTVSYGDSIFCEAGDSLEIALIKDGTPGRWSSTIDYSASNEFTVVDISGDGYNLFRPTEIDEYQQPVDLEKLNTNDSSDYVELEIAFRSVSKMNVYFSGESFLIPADPDKTGNIYGEFSRDYVAGAMRVAVIDGDEVKMIWAPNSQYELIQGIGHLDAEYAFNPNSTNAQTYSYYAENEEGELVEQSIPNDWFASKKFVVDSTGAEKGWARNSPVLLSLDPKEGEHDQKTVKIRIWFEGTDREAHQALAGGNVKVQLKFLGIAKTANEAGQAEIDNIAYDDYTFTGLSAGMVFSADGQNWTEYTPATPNLPELQSGDSIYIKYPETIDYYETTYVKFTKN